MLGVEVGEEKTDGDRFHVGLRQFLANGFHLRRVDFREHVAAGTDSLRHFHSKAARDQDLGLRVSDVVQQLRGTGDATQLEGIPKAPRRDQGRLCTPPLDDRVRSDRAAVGNETHVATRNAKGVHRFAKSRNRRVGNPLRGGGHLGNLKLSGVLIKHHDVGERAADIDADALHGSRCPNMVASRFPAAPINKTARHDDKLPNGVGPHRPGFESGVLRCGTHPWRRHSEDESGSSGVGWWDWGHLL